jgi:hypothetical protein
MALLEAFVAIEHQIARPDERLKRLALRALVCWDLTTVPATGPCLALFHAKDRGRKPAPSKAQRRSLSGAYDQVLPIQRKGEKDVVLGITAAGGDAKARQLG